MTLDENRLDGYLKSRKDSGINVTAAVTGEGRYIFIYGDDPVSKQKIAATMDTFASDPELADFTFRTAAKLKHAVSPEDFPLPKEEPAQRRVNGLMRSLLSRLRKLFGYDS